MKQTQNLDYFCPCLYPFALILYYLFREESNLPVVLVIAGGGALTFDDGEYVDQ